MRQLIHSCTGVEKVSIEGLQALVEQFRADTDPNRTDLLVGVYKTEEGKAYVLPSVKEVSSLKLLRSVLWYFAKYLTLA
jgi:aspartate/tyrosine/aromatic aminotransferase